MYVDIRITRRETLRLFGVGTAVALLAACGPSAPTAPASSTPAGPAPAAPGGAAPTAPAAAAAAAAQAKVSATPLTGQPKSGGVLTMALSTDLDSLEPHAKTEGRFTVLYPIHDRLMAFDTKMQLQPRLAESWDISSDGKQWKLNLRKGVQFHSGREFTSDDVKFNVMRASDTTLGGQLDAWAGWFTDIQTPDKYTVVLRMEKNYSGVEDLFGLMNIIDKDTTPGKTVTKVVGTGPFTFVDWAQGDHYTLAKNKNYWMSDRPYIDGITFKIFKDQTAKVVAFESGAVDIIDNLSTEDRTRLQQDSKYNIVVGEPLIGYQLVLNTTWPPFDNKKVRQALNYALNRKLIMDTLWPGNAEPGALPWAPTFPAYDAAKNNSYAFDLNKTKSMLSEAGVTNLEFDFEHQISEPILTKIGLIYQSDLAKIGVKVNITPTEPVIHTDLMVNHKLKGMGVTRITPDTQLPHFVIQGNSGQKPTNNWTGLDNPEYTQLIKNMASETDAAKYKQLVSQMNDMMLDASSAIVLGLVRPVLATQAKVHGARRDVQMLNVTDAWIG
jgi:peptide/nickel transport system substrate-binding protein